MGSFGLLLDASARPDESIRLQLAQCGYLMRTVHDGVRAAQCLREETPAFTLIRAIASDGIELCRSLRPLSQAPFIVVSTQIDERTTIDYFRAGADIVLCLPVSRRELAARINAAIGGASVCNTSPRPSVCQLGDLTIDIDAHVAIDAGRVLPLTPTEFRLLTALARRAGQIVGHRELIADVWGADATQGPENLRLYIRYLRRKLGDDLAIPQKLVTHRGIGYRLTAAYSAVSTKRRDHGGNKEASGKDRDARTRRRVRQGRTLASIRR